MDGNKTKEKMKLKKGAVFFVIFLIVIASLIFYFVSKPKTTQPEEIHYHPRININLCGQTMSLPKNTGIATLHTHDDVPILHLEGQKALLQDYFRIIKIPFNDTCFNSYCNSDICPHGSEPGQLRVLVNGTERPEKGKYELKDGDEVLIEFK